MKSKEICCFFLIVFAFTSGIALGHCIPPFLGQLLELKKITPSTFYESSKTVEVVRPEHDKEYYRKKSFFEQHGRDDYDIVFIGDSITEAADWEELFPMFNIANRGIGGDKTKGVLKRLNSIYSTSAQKAFIMIGVNDFNKKYDLEVNETFKNYKDIVEKLVAHGLEVYIQSTILTGEEEEKSINHRIRSLNRQLKILASHTDTVQYIDLNEKLAKNFTLDSRYSNDGVHLNGDGYEIWKKVLSNYIN